MTTTTRSWEYYRRVLGQPLIPYYSVQYYRRTRPTITIHVTDERVRTRDPLEIPYRTDLVLGIPYRTVQIRDHDPIVPYRTVRVRGRQEASTDYTVHSSAVHGIRGWVSGRGSCMGSCRARVGRKSGPGRTNNDHMSHRMNYDHDL